MIPASSSVKDNMEYVFGETRCIDYEHRSKDFNVADKF